MRTLFRYEPIEEALRGVTFSNTYYLTGQFLFRGDDIQYEEFASTFYWIGMAKLYEDQWKPLKTSIHPKGHSNPHMHSIPSKRRPYVSKKWAVGVQRGVDGYISRWWLKNAIPPEEIHRETKIEYWSDWSLLNRKYADRRALPMRRRSAKPFKIERYDPTKGALQYLQTNHRVIYHHKEPFRY